MSSKIEAGIEVRRAEPDDYEAVHRIFSAPKVIWGTMQVPFPSLEAWKKRMVEPAEGVYGLVACLQGEVIGHLALHTYPNFPRRRHAGRLGMAVRDDRQGQGAGMALMQGCIDLADRWLNLTRLELEVYTDNAAAVALYKKCGFVVEGTLVQFALRDGQFVDAYAMARLKP